jgi:hypothetical protein
MATYSQSSLGLSAGGLFAVKNLTLSDAQASAGGQANAMQNGTAFLCKNPDGSQSYYKLDAERSTSTYRVLVPLGP